VVWATGATVGLLKFLNPHNHASMTIQCRMCPTAQNYIFCERTLTSEVRLIRCLAPYADLENRDHCWFEF